MTDSTHTPPPAHPWRGRFRRGAVYVLFGNTGKGFGRRLSMYTSFVSIFLMWIFFFKMRGWTPPSGQEVDYATYVNWTLQLVLGVQMIILVATIEGGHRGEVIIDTLTSAACVGFICYVLGLHAGGYELLPKEQARYAVSALFTFGTDFIVDFAVALLAQSRTLGVSS